MAIEDQLTTFKSSLDSIKTALSNKGVSTSGNLTADQVSSKISSINTNQTTTKNMGSQSVTFQEKTYTVKLELGWNYYVDSKSVAHGLITNGLVGIEGISGSGNGKKYSSSSQTNRASTFDGSYTSASAILSAYQQYKTSKKWPAFTKKNTSTMTYVTAGCDFTYTNVLPGTYRLYTAQYIGTGATWPTFTVGSSDVSKSFGLFTPYS